MVVRTRNSKRKREMETREVLLGALMAVVHNDWISARDVCRLEQTAKSVYDFIGTNNVWKELCCHRWRNTRPINPGLILMIGGYKVFYRQRLASLVPCNTYTPLPPLKIKPEHAGLLVDVSVRGKSVVSDLYSGEELFNALTKNGIVPVGLNKPHVVGKKQCWFHPRGCQCANNNSKCNFNRHEYDARVHFISFSNFGTSCCVYEPSQKEFTMESPLIENVPDEENFTWIDCGRSLNGQRPYRRGLTLRNNPESAEIERRLRAEVCFFFSIRLGVFGDDIVINGFQIDVLYCKHDEGSTRWSRFDEQFSQETGVTLIHVLEQIQGSDCNPPKGEPKHVAQEDHSLIYLN